MALVQWLKKAQAEFFTILLGLFLVGKMGSGALAIISDLQSGRGGGGRRVTL